MAGELSKGNQQLVQIAGTLIHNPDLIILDEPFSGLDPVNADILKDVIEGLVAEKKTVILSSHQMNQIETFCQDIVILNSGKTILKGALSEIKANYGFKYVKMESRDSLTDSLQEMGYDVEIKGNTYQIKLASTFDALSLGQTLMSSHNKNITSFTVQEPSLHQIFVERTG
jgi:ABC-2 type transport system ATP-binding protein